VAWLADYIFFMILQLAKPERYYFLLQINNEIIRFDLNDYHTNTGFD